MDAALQAAIEVARQRESPRAEALTALRAAEELGQVWSPAWRRELLLDCAKRFEALQMPWYRARAEEILRST